MRVLLTGASGSVGRFLLPALRTAGHRVVTLGRRPGDHLWDLADPAPRLPPADALVHAALAHAPGRFRGGEGDDPALFRRLNLGGTLRLLDAVGTARVVFLSSRAVYGDGRRGEILRETDVPAPDSLYGEVKLAGEAAVADRGGVALRATGVYGGRPHKWEALFDAYLRGDPIAPRCATEVHGADLAAAALLALASPIGDTLNVSDLLLDRRDLLVRVQAATGSPHPPPPPAEGTLPGIMATDRLRALGWRPGGLPRLEAFLAETLSGR
ncbi:MAG: SDR family oxidoreductase [Amaricoccus sp.]